MEFVEGESSDEFDESADELGEYLDDQHFGFGKKLCIIAREADTIPIRGNPRLACGGARFFGCVLKRDAIF